MNYLKTNFITDSYADLIMEKIKLGYQCYLVTFLFPKLAGSYESLIQQMKDVFRAAVIEKAAEARLNEEKSDDE